jgi:hypothetical protein
LRLLIDWDNSVPLSPGRPVVDEHHRLIAEDCMHPSGAARVNPRLIAIKVMRVPGNPLIKGTFWLDDVKLVAVTPESNH